MQTISRIPTLREQIHTWHCQNQCLALVPTMGNLHAGHLELVRRAREQCRRVIVSIFVNPLQFGPNEDFAAYPRTLAADERQLIAAGVDLLFIPTPIDMYPHGQTEHTRVEVPGLADELCGAQRPGHFIGVATVVCKLFNLTQPTLALFGEKDFQQLRVIQRMSADLHLTVTILGVPTVREADGLALSSRNAYLSPEERPRAACLYLALQHGAAALERGDAYSVVEMQAWTALLENGLHPEYVSVRRAQDLKLPAAGERNLVILAAARLGRTRLIDNCRACNA